ncbi:hypothetical protein APV28_4616 [Comamonas testosteroni]|nr:hypothetical protein APV28_4616 [Comamonas testosteroni]
MHIKLNPCQASRTSPERPITKSQRAEGRLGHGGFGQVDDETSRRAEPAGISQCS